MENNNYQDLLALSDGLLRTEDGYTFDIHKIVLSRKSDYFNSLFNGDVGKGRNDFLIPGINGEILGKVLSYIYSGKVGITGTNVHDILLAANNLLCDDLIDHIQEVYMKDSLSVNNCLPLFIAGLKINRNEILRACFRFIQTHFEDVVTIDDSEVGELPLQSLELFLGDKNLRVKDENIVWMSIYKWVLHDRGNRLCHVPNLLMFMTVSDVDEQLSKTIFEHDLVACNPFCEEINTIRQSRALDLNSFFSRLFGYFNVEIFREFSRKHSKPELTSSRCRLPEHMHFIIKLHHKYPSISWNYYIYVTYDENIDLWRKVIEVDIRPQYMECIGDNIYMGYWFRPITQFYLPEKKWIPMPQFRDERERYSMVQLRGFIYVLGGRSLSLWNLLSGGIVNSVEMYNPVTNVWTYVSPMMKMGRVVAVTLENKIYVVGVSQRSMVAQSYNSESNTWTVLNSPSCFCYDFTIFTYRGRLFLMGTLDSDELRNVIHVFDPAREEWTAHTDLPHSFCIPKAVIFNKELIICEDESDRSVVLKSNTAVTWDGELKCWKISEQSSALNTLWKYNVFTHETRGCTNHIIRESKNTSTQFVNSPFI